jgi:hypothetical protein
LVYSSVEGKSSDTLHIHSPDFSFQTNFIWKVRKGWLGTKRERKCWIWKPKGQMSEYPIPHGEHYDSCILRRRSKSAFLHPEEEIQGVIDLPQCQ